MSRSYNRFQVALDIQNACNLSGVAREFVKVVDDARAKPIVSGDQTMSDHWHLRRDPAVVLLVNKIESMVGSQESFAAAYAECEAQAPVVADADQRAAAATAAALTAIEDALKASMTDVVEVALRS